MFLFVTSDAGPAKYLSVLINKSNFKYAVVGTNISSKVFNQYNIDSVNSFSSIDLKKIDLIITGTCLDDCLDKKAILIAKNNSITSISIIEHWSHYKERFFLKDKLILPDYIFINDTKSKKDAISAGLPKEKLIIVGNPYLESISKKQLSPIPKNVWLSKLGFNNKPVITFISEIYQDDFPKDSNNYPGFDEYIVLETILEIVTENDFNVLIRNHPSESPNKYNKYIQNHVANDNLGDYDSTIINSDFIVGMGSMFLIEASMFREDIISYRPDERYEFIGNELNMTLKVTSKQELEEVLNNKKGVNKNTKYILITNSAERINDFFDRIIKKIK